MAKVIVDSNRPKYYGILIEVVTDGSLGKELTYELFCMVLELVAQPDMMLSVFINKGEGHTVVHIIHNNPVFFVEKLDEEERIKP